MSPVESSLVVRDACGTLVPKVAVCDHFYGTNKSRWLGALLAVAQSSNRHLSSNATSTRQGCASRQSVGWLRVYPFAVTRGWPSGPLA